MAGRGLRAHTICRLRAFADHSRATPPPRRAGYATLILRSLKHRLNDVSACRFDELAFDQIKRRAVLIGLNVELLFPAE
jgi:hypothetical protein